MGRLLLALLPPCSSTTPTSEATTTVDSSGHSAHTTLTYVTSALPELKSLQCTAMAVTSAHTTKVTTPSVWVFATGTTSLMDTVAQGAQSGAMTDVLATEAAKLNLSLKK